MMVASYENSVDKHHETRHGNYVYGRKWEIWKYLKCPKPTMMKEFGESGFSGGPFVAGRQRNLQCKVFNNTKDHFESVSGCVRSGSELQSLPAGHSQGLDTDDTNLLHYLHYLHRC